MPARNRTNQRRPQLDFGFSEPGERMLNYRHLHYFWVVTKEGGFARAAERLDMA
ncbi:MAG: LysR family transcriptional regulator, partial [Comamonadaceae bacterium]